MRGQHPGDGGGPGELLGAGPGHRPPLIQRYGQQRLDAVGQAEGGRGGHHAIAGWDEFPGRGEPGDQRHPGRDAVAECGVQPFVGGRRTFGPLFRA